jgi:quercetin 2,3-dioxygenase
MEARRCTPGGVIGLDDVQWVTAGAGILHEEFHSERFMCSGGVLDMVQLWVNLPARDKQTAPRDQAIASAQIPNVALRTQRAACGS